jgi:ribosome modulation factor
MRTVLDRNALVFEEGFKAYEAGTPRNLNPYSSGELRSQWFDGWDHAQGCGGTCG